MKQNRGLMMAAVLIAAAVVTAALTLAGCGSTQTATGEDVVYKFTFVDSTGHNYGGEIDGVRSEKEARERFEQMRAAEAAEEMRLANLPPSTPEDFTYTLNRDGKGLTITGYKGTSPNVVVPREIEGFPVKNIGNYVFNGYDTGREKEVARANRTPLDTTKFDLRSVVIPDTVVFLGEGAFRDSVIGSITIPGGVYGTFVYGYFPFERASITTLTFEKTVPSEKEFFSGSGFVKDSAHITNLVLPSGITVIPEHLWDLYEPALQSITIPDTVTKIEAGAFSGSGLRSITLPARLTEIGAAAFANNGKLTGIVIPGSVTKIGERVFSQCEALSSVTLPTGLTEIPGGLFSGNKNLKSITIPETVKKIGDNAFKDSGLESVTLPAGLQEIGREAFANCKNLKAITIPDSITSIRFPTTVNTWEEDWGPQTRINPNKAFSGCPTPPLATQAKLRQLGYTDAF